LRNVEPTLHSQICFECQQSAEKYLKALLQESGLPVPRTHHLVDLLKLLLPHDPGLKSLMRGLDFLTRFAVEFRYPGENANGRQAQAAVRWAERVEQEIRLRLKLAP
jgi:HEPN domain-containing protein